jgi:hypothetical protein
MMTWHWRIMATLVLSLVEQELIASADEQTRTSVRCLYSVGEHRCDYFARQWCLSVNPCRRGSSAREPAPDPMPPNS